jgi:predicted Rossmann fold nucleotide-binding protein DprA/Smf involved in DNA uptake
MVDFNRAMCRVTLTSFFADVYGPRIRRGGGDEMPEALALVPRPGERLALQGLALALTPRLGRTMRRLVEHFGACRRFSRRRWPSSRLPAFKPSRRNRSAPASPWNWRMTNWDAWRRLVFPSSAWMNSTYPAQLKQIYDPPPVLYVRGNVDPITQPGVAVVGTRHPAPYGLGMASAWRATSPSAGWSFSAAWLAA